MISRSVSMANSATERFHTPDDGVDDVVDMLEVRPETEDRAAKAIAAVDARAAHHHTPLLLDMLHQPLVELIEVPAFRQIAEGDDRKLRFGSGIEPVDFGQARMEIARERKLFGLG